MNSCWSVSSEKLGHRKQEAPELRAHKDKTRTHCGTMESCLIFPQFHSTAATQNVITCAMDTGPKKGKDKGKEFS